MRVLFVLGALCAFGCQRHEATSATVSSAQPQPQPQAPAKEAPLDSSCEQDSDCTPAPSCCPAPCTQHVINVKDLPLAQKQLESCPKGVECPVAGSCMTHRYLCVKKQCALVYEGDPAYHSR